MARPVDLGLRLSCVIIVIMKVMTEYTVIYEPGERNWSAYVPDLPGCVATAKTRKKLEIKIRQAIEFHIEGLRLDGEPIPQPTIEVGIVAVIA